MVNLSHVILKNPNDKVKVRAVDGAFAKLSPVCSADDCCLLYTSRSACQAVSPTTLQWPCPWLASLASHRSGVKEGQERGRKGVV